MRERVLVPTDGSPLAERALRYAVAEFPEAAVTTLHVIDPFESVVAAEAGGLPDAAGWYEAAQEGARAIHERAAEIADEAGVELTTATEVGAPARTIVEYAASNDVDHVVLGSHGRTGVSRVLLGSVAETVVRRAGCPVTVVR